MIKHRLAVGVDDRYVGPLLVALYSAWVGASRPFRLIVGFVPSELSSKNRDLISAVAGHLGVALEFIEVQLPLMAVGDKRISPSSYIRLVLADRLDETFVWVDCDVILEQGWDELLTLQSRARVVISAVRDNVINSRPNVTGNQSVLRSQGNYFNSGVILVDARAWSNQRFDVAWKVALSRYEELKFQYLDQCVLNYTLAGHTDFLEAKFNVLELLDESTHTGERIIRHYAGNIKPWHYSSEWDLLLWLVPYRRDSVRRFFEIQRRFFSETEHIPEVQEKFLGVQLGRINRPSNFTLEHIASAMRRMRLHLRKPFS